MTDPIDADKAFACMTPGSLRSPPTTPQRCQQDVKQLIAHAGNRNRPAVRPAASSHPSPPDRSLHGDDWPSGSLYPEGAYADPNPLHWLPVHGPVESKRKLCLLCAIHWKVQSVIINKTAEMRGTGHTRP